MKDFDEAFDEVAELAVKVKAAFEGVMRLNNKLSGDEYLELHESQHHLAVAADEMQKALRILQKATVGAEFPKFR